MLSDHVNILYYCWLSELQPLQPHLIQYFGSHQIQNYMARHSQRPGSITWHCNDGTSSTKCLPHLIHLKDLSYFLDKGTLVTRDYQPNLNFISGWHTPAKLSHWIKFFINSLIKSLNKIFSWTETLYKQVQLPASSSIIKVKGKYTGWGLIINTKCHWKPARRIPICNLLNLIKQN